MMDRHRWRAGALVGRSARAGAGLALPLRMLGALCLVGCGGTLPREGPVMLDPEDEDSPQAGLSCRVTSRADLPGPATTAPPALATDGADLVVAWVLRPDRQRLLRIQRLDSRLSPTVEPLDLDPEGQIPTELRISSCGSELLLAWQQRAPEGDSIRLARLARGALQPELPPLLVAPRGVQPALGCAGERGALVWSTREGGLQDVYLRWIEGAAGLGPPLRINGTTGGASHPAIACEADRCVVVWSGARAVYHEIYAAFAEVGETEPGEPHRVSEHDQTLSGAGGAYDPDVALLGDDRFLVSWHDSRSGDESELYAATLSALGTAGGDRRLTRSTSSSTGAEAASCADGLAAVAFRDRRHGPPAVMFAAVDAEARRSSAVITLGGEGADEASTPSAACVGDGTYAVAWTEAGAQEEARLRLALVECR